VAQPGENFASIGVEIMFPAYYSYYITGNVNSFTATAGTKSTSGLDVDPTADVWTINQNGVITCVINDTDD
jgi:hypothetical protein